MKRSGAPVGSVRTAWLWLLVVVVLPILSPHGRATEAGETPRTRIEALRAEIARHDELYFKQAKPEITDAEYDRLKRELNALEAAHPEAAGTGGVPSLGDDRSGLFPVHRHREPMLSLDKAYTEAEWRAFHGRVARQLNQGDPVFVIEPKYDGIAISLIYERGRLVRAVTRGNGTEGDDVTANVRTIRSLPEAMKTTDAAFPLLVELRGEIYLEHAEFSRINAERLEEGQEPFAHPRNLAAGTLKSLEPVEGAQRRLSVVIHGWGAWEGGESPESQQAFQATVRAWGLPAVGEVRLARTVEDVWAAVRALGHARSRLAFPVDGAVVKLDEVATRGLLGAGSQAPRWAIACKYEPERAVTQLRGITWQVGRTGVLTPVAEFDAVMLGGSIVTRATLHNGGEIARRDLRIGDFIEVEKAGDVIPAIGRVLLARRPGGAVKAPVPVHCPACGAQLASKPNEAAVRCPNAGCPAQRQRRLEHFASAQAMDLEGFGPAMVAVLIEAGLLRTPADFYRLRRDDLAKVAGVGPKTAGRLQAGIERRKTPELWRVIYGLGIPQVGAARARQLALRCGDLETLAGMKESDLAEIIGPAAAASVTEFMIRVENRADIRALIEAGVRPVAPHVPAGGLQGKVFVLTGTLPGFNRAQAAERVQAVGGIVRDNVSRQTDYVVAGEGAGAKLADAERLGVRVIGFEEFKRMMGIE